MKLVRIRRTRRLGGRDAYILELVRFVSRAVTRGIRRSVRCGFEKFCRSEDAPEIEVDGKKEQQRLGKDDAEDDAD